MESDPTVAEIDEMVDRASSAERRPRRMARRKEQEAESDEGVARLEDAPANAASAAAEEASDETVRPRKKQPPALPQKTMAELDLADVLPRELPKPTENVKTLGDLNARYNIGDSTDFKLQVWRTYPKLFPGGVKADGFYDTWDQALTEELIQSEYGGGVYRVVVVGPHPSKPNNTKHYDSISISIPGDAKHTRLPKAMQAVAQGGDIAPPSPLPAMMMPSAENPKLSEAAMKLAFDVADKEREERKRIEERSADAIDRAQRIMDPIVEAHSRRADDLVRAERERSETERRMLNERLDEERHERRRIEEKLEAVTREFQMQRNSAAAELRELLPLMKGNGDEGKTAERMLESVLDKHRGEIEAMRATHASLIESINRQHQDALSSMREAHRLEVATLREATTREVQSERDAARRREERIEDQLKAEREERRRDQDRFREQLNERDQSWKDRLEMQKQSQEQSWDARHQSVVANYENRLLWQAQEIDRLKADMAELRAKATDSSDPIAIVAKAREIKEAIGGPEASASSSGGGLGLGAGGEDWRTIAAEGLVERVPQILGTIGTMLGGQGGAQQQPAAPQASPRVGSIIQTPQGEMVVVSAPNMPGGVGMMPKAAFEAQQAAAQQQSARRLSGGGRLARRVMPDVDEVLARRQSRRGSVSVVPNLGAGLPRRRPPWEGGGEEAPVQQAPVQQAPPQQAPPQAQAVPVSAQAAPLVESGSRRPSPIERQGLRVIAKLVHDSVMNADEPEDFVRNVMQQWPPDVLKRIAGSYTVDEVIVGVQQIAPQGAGATPEGQKFCREAFTMLKETIG